MKWVLILALMAGCGDSGDADDAGVPAVDSAPEPVTCDPDAPQCGQYERCLEIGELGFICRVPVCEFGGVGTGPCCDLQGAGGGSARGVCLEGQCHNSQGGQENERCAALTN